MLLSQNCKDFLSESLAHPSPFMNLASFLEPITAGTGPRQVLIGRDPQLLYMQIIIDCGTLSFKWKVNITFFTAKFGDYCGKGDRNIVKARGGCWLKEATVFSEYSSFCMWTQGLGQHAQDLMKTQINNSP